MKKVNILFFIIPIIYGLLVFGTEGISALWTAPKTMAVLAMFMISGIIMQKGKVCGAFVTIIPLAVWSAVDYIQNYQLGWPGETPEYRICIPLIILYLCCAYSVKSKNMAAGDNKNEKT